MLLLGGIEPLRRTGLVDTGTDVAMNSAHVTLVKGDFGILLSPMLAAMAMSLSSASVVGNALRLRGAS